VFVDEMALVIVDLPGREMRDPALLEELESLRQWVVERYWEAESPQEEVWIVAHPVLIFAKGRAGRRSTPDWGSGS